MTHFKATSLALSVILLFLAGCAKDKEVVTNKPPTVDAGPSKTITLPIDSVLLSGTASDTDGHVVAYLWSEVAGPAAISIINPGASSTRMKGFLKGTYVFQLMATDNLGATGVDTVTVIVNPSNKIDTLTLQPFNNPYDYSVSHINGVDVSGNAAISIEATAWTNGGYPQTVRGLIKFDLSTIPASATILSANLYLYSNPAPNTGNLADPNFGPANSFVLQQVTTNWTTVSWNNQPVSATSNQIVVPATGQAPLDLNLDVTAMVSSMVNNNANYGFSMKLQTETPYNSRIFVSSHNSTYPAKRPKLVVTYK